MKKLWNVFCSGFVLVMFMPISTVYAVEGALAMTYEQYVSLKKQMHDFEKTHSKELKKLRVERLKKQLAHAEEK